MWLHLHIMAFEVSARGSVVEKYEGDWVNGKMHGTGKCHGSAVQSQADLRRTRKANGFVFAAVILNTSQYCKVHFGDPGPDWCPWCR